MQKILLTGLLILLLAVPAPAAEKEVAGVFFPLPEGWSVVEENTSGTTSTLLLRQEGRRTAIAVMVAADAGLAPARIAAELASVTGATADPVEREGQYSFPIRKDGQDGVCFLAQSNGRFILVSVLGELPPAVPLLEGMRCPADPGLVLHGSFPALKMENVPVLPQGRFFMVRWRSGPYQDRSRCCHPFMAAMGRVSSVCLCFRRASCSVQYVRGGGAGGGLYA